MYKNQKIIVVMPAYNAAQTLRQTFDEVMAQEIVDLVIIVDDKSSDETVAIAKSLPNTMVYTHKKNMGYGGNQKSCYRLALEQDGDIIIMVQIDMLNHICLSGVRRIKRKLMNLLIGGRTLLGHRVVRARCRNDRKNG